MITSKKVSTDAGGHAGLEILQLVANQLLFDEWLQTIKGFSHGCARRWACTCRACFESLGPEAFEGVNLRGASGRGALH